MNGLELVKVSARELQERIDEHCRLLAGTMNHCKAELDTCNLLDCPHRRKLVGTLVETIRVLEETRRAFKSRRLEVLRKRLMDVLVEQD